MKKVIGITLQLFFLFGMAFSIWLFNLLFYNLLPAGVNVFFCYVLIPFFAANCTYVFLRLIIAKRYYKHVTILHSTPYIAGLLAIIPLMLFNNQGGREFVYLNLAGIEGMEVDFDELDEQMNFDIFPYLTLRNCYPKSNLSYIHYEGINFEEAKQGEISPQVSFTQYQITPLFGSEELANIKFFIVSKEKLKFRKGDILEGWEEKDNFFKAPYRGRIITNSKEKRMIKEGIRQAQYEHDLRISPHPLTFIELMSFAEAKQYGKQGFIWSSIVMTIIFFVLPLIWMLTFPPDVTPTPEAGRISNPFVRSGAR